MPRHHRRAARRAHGIEHIELLEIRALAGEPVEVRRLQPRMPVADKIAPAPVVGEDEDDVGLCVGGVGGVQRGQRSQQQGGEGREHSCCHDFAFSGGGAKNLSHCRVRGVD